MPGKFEADLGTYSAASSTTPIVDANEPYSNFCMVVTADATVTGYSVQLKGSLDGRNFYNIGFPMAAAGTLGNQIGPVTNSTYNYATWMYSPFRYFQATVAISSGNGNVNVRLACT